MNKRFDQLLKLHEELAKATAASTTGKAKENLTPRMGEALIWRVLQYLEVFAKNFGSANLKCQSSMVQIQMARF